ncbi:MAG TPA: ATP-binding protein [Verrucomicrobiae bacterium]|nr:ATP-binding protein [Verrucomicrobiae bacterium]
MKNTTVSNLPEIKRAYQEWDRSETINNFKIACCLGIILMPGGAIIDHFVYPDRVRLFLGLRLLCSVLVGAFMLVLLTPFARRYYRGLGVALAMLPSFFMSLLIYLSDGPHSTYYAGLNLVLLTVAFVMHWTFLESMLAVLLGVFMYVLACGLNQQVNRWGELLKDGGFLTNMWFLSLTGIIVITGRFFHSQYRFREFALRFELDRNKQMLEESNRKLVELDQIKGRFFANISHELRTPLTLLIAPLESLLRRFGLDADTKDLLATMHSNGMRLLKLINDLLDLVRLESGRMEIKSDSVNLADFLKGLASAARQVADDKRLRLEIQVDPQLGTVQTDRDKLEKIVLNLLFNALKFTPSGGRVELRASHEQNLFAIRVADTGMGISEKNLPHVFDRFWQADGSSKRKYQGVGIGLALVKELVEVQKGQVSVESQEGKGTTFTVLLPYHPAQAPALAPKPTVEEPAAAEESTGSTVTSEEWLANLYRRAELFPALTPVQDSMRPLETQSNGNHPTILVADDEPDMLRFLKSQLSTHYRVLEAVDGQQAIEKASQFLPDIILLDMMMPEKDGLQACRELRERTSTQSIPVVLLTARADEETKLAALSAGASDFLAKPFSTTELHVRIKNLVESHQYQGKLSKQKQVLESTIEQLKDTETQLVQTEKLASLGRMSAGIIHEINNPLNFATTGLFTLRNKSKYIAEEQREEYQEILKDVEDGIVRVKNIVTDLRMFTHPETESRDQVELSEVLSASLRFLSAELKNTVRIEQHLAEHQTVWANKNKLIHLLTNLLQNSLDALKNKTFDTDQPTIWIEGRLKGASSILVVRDNGTGIKQEHLDKIFDPFYTTKDVGQGMGLGLAICYRIVQDCDGRISVRTEPGKFCEFTLEFPSKG